MKNDDFIPVQQENQPVLTPEMGPNEPAENLPQMEDEAPQEPEFVPILIHVDHWKIDRLTKLYGQLCGDLNCLASELAHLRDEKEPTLEMVLDFLAAENQDSFLKLLFIQTNGITFPGLSMEKILQLDLVEVPEQYYSDCEQAKKSFIMVWESLQKILKMEFEYPLGRLWFVDPETQQRYFDLDPKFHETVKNHCSLYTQTPDQNRALGALTKICEGCNELHRMTYSGFNFRHGPDEVNKLIQFLDISPAAENVVGFDAVLLFRSFRGADVAEKRILRFPSESTDLFEGYPRTKHLQKVIESKAR